MFTEEVYYWRIQWAGTWMLTYRRFSEREIRLEHLEAICVEGSGESVLVSEDQMQAHTTSHSSYSFYF